MNDPELTENCKISLTTKQSKYIAARAKGLSKKDACKKAGYSDNSTPTKLEQSPKLKNALVAALGKVGVGEHYLARKIKEGLLSKDYRFFSADGLVTDQKIVPDYSVREKYLRSSLEVMGYIRAGNDVHLNLGVISVSSEKLSGEWNESSIAVEPTVKSDFIVGADGGGGLIQSPAPAIANNKT